MLVLEDVFDAVAEAVAVGAVAELHAGMGEIGDAADGAFMERLTLARYIAGVR